MGCLWRRDARPRADLGPSDPVGYSAASEHGSRLGSAVYGAPRRVIGFMPLHSPWKVGHAEPGAIHWDHNPWNAAKRTFQGVLALTDTSIDQGGFCCVPSLYRNPDAWPDKPIIDEAGAEEWLANTNGCEIVHVPARAGDLVVWDSRLPHSNSKNLSGKPRIAFYVMMCKFACNNDPLRGDFRVQ